MESPPVIFSQRDWDDLRLAKSLLEHTSFTMRLTDLAGTPVEAAVGLLPAGWRNKIDTLAKTALLKALEVAVATTQRRPTTKPPSNRLHKVLVGASGGVGGAFGLAAMAVELPISTTIMLRSIVEIARSEGHDPSSIETKLDCLEVFAFGGGKKSANAKETTYWATRLALSQSLKDATVYLAGKGVVEKSAPVVARLVASISSRFGTLVTEEAAAKALPALGAVGGSVVNVIFMDHFQHMARGHFIIRRLEKKHGADEVQRRYNEV